MTGFNTPDIWFYAVLSSNSEEMICNGYPLLSQDFIEKNEIWRIGVRAEGLAKNETASYFIHLEDKNDDEQ